MAIRLQIARSFIGGLHFRHVDGKNKRKFAHIVCVKMELTRRGEKNLIVPYHQHGRHDVTCNQPIGVVLRKMSMKRMFFHRRSKRDWFIYSFLV